MFIRYFLHIILRAYLMTNSSDMRKINPWVALALFIVGCMALGSASGLLSNSGPGPWYDALEKSSLTPPSWVFGVVWPTLYLLMAVAVWMIWRLPDSTARTNALWLFAAQFLINLSWSPMFFGAQLILPSLIVIVVLFVVLALTIRRFHALETTAAVLLLPYLAWTGFAGYLELVIYLKNSA